MFVSRKCLAAFIHLFPRELSTRIHVAQLIHQRPEFLRATLPACEPFQPIAEKLMQRSVLTLRFLSGQLDVGLLCVERNILSHENSVHESRVFEQAWIQPLRRSVLLWEFPLFRAQVVQPLVLAQREMEKRRSPFHAEPKQV